LKFVLKLYLETIGADRGMGGHIHIKPNEGYHIIIINNNNTSPLTKPSAELEIKIDVKYVGEDERTDG
jgi:hypothetical protein